nr:uncharacterized protein LOC126519934 [Dermacentor andersoni]
MPVESFLELLFFYLGNTVVKWGSSMYVQKSGVCIGSKVAPVLSDIYLSRVNRKLRNNLKELAVHAFRYVDDYLVFCSRDNYTKKATDILKVFRECGGGLGFTLEIIQDNNLQFLDLCLTFQDEHVCWHYSPRAKKPLLEYSSCHSKLVKRGIAYSTLRSAITKSCPHNMQQSFSQQIERLKKASYPVHLLSLTCEKLVKWVKSPGKKQEKQKKETKFAVVPYIHRLSHGLRNVANRYDVSTVFSAPRKLSNMCPLINRRLEQEGKKRKDDCGVKHVSPLVPCNTGIVYQIPLECGKAYIGQSGRCINIRLKEHKHSLNNPNASHLAAHCFECGCKPFFEDTKILSKHRCQTTREIIEAFHIKRLGDTCVSHASLSLLDCEFQYLRNTCTNL